MSNYKYISGGESYELQPAEVLKVNYKDNDPEQIYSIVVKPLLGSGIRSTTEGITARPLNYNIKKVPLVGEVVIIMNGPSPGASDLSNATQNYYIDTYSVQSLLHHNAIPNITKTKKGNKFDINNRNNVEAGHTQINEDNNSNFSFAKSFVERNNIRPVQHYAGDMILEGRFNQGIRFTSTFSNFDDYSLEPTWKKGISIDGDPLLIIRNGRNPNSISKEVNKFYIENIEDDLASIWMSAGQQLPYKPKYSNFESTDRLSINTFRKDEFYTGNQIGIFSDRIIIGAKTQEIVLQSESGISINSAKSVALDIEDTFEVNASLINLGIDANEPALLGNTSTTWLSNLLTQLITLCNTLAVEVHPTGTGPSLPPIQASTYVSISNQLITLQNQLETLKSQLVFLNKN